MKRCIFIDFDNGTENQNLPIIKKKGHKDSWITIKKWQIAILNSLGLILGRITCENIKENAKSLLKWWWYHKKSTNFGF